MRIRISTIIIPVVAGAITLVFLLRPPGRYILPEKSGIRIATYNIAFLTESESPERIANLRSVIRAVNADVWGLQEIESKRAAQQVFGDEYEIGIVDDRGESQDLAIAVKKPAKLQNYNLLFTDSGLNEWFPNKRDVLRATVLLGDREIVFYVVHYKSRSGGRLETESRRIGASRILLDYLRVNPNEQRIILGDFNDTPDDACLNILESGDGRAGGEMTDNPGSWMFNAAQSLWNDNQCSLEVFLNYRGHWVSPKNRGARKENDRLRGVHYRYPDDVPIPQILFDQILVSPSLHVTRSFIYSDVDAVRGLKSDVIRDANGHAVVRSRGGLASDHLPVFTDVAFGSR